MMSLQEATRAVFDACRAVGDDLNVTFDDAEITVYWENLRFDVQPKDLEKALRVIKLAKALGARFE